MDPVSFYKSDASIQASKEITRAQKDVLNLLTSCAQQWGVAWPSYEYIMEACAIGSRSTVRKALKALEDKKYISVKHGKREGARNEPNLYYILQQEKSLTIQKIKKEPYVTKNSIIRNAIESDKIREKIKGLKISRKILEKSGAMTSEIGWEIEKALKGFTTELSKL